MGIESEECFVSVQKGGSQGKHGNGSLSSLLNIKDDPLKQYFIPVIESKPLSNMEEILQDKATLFRSTQKLKKKICIRKIRNKSFF